MRFLTDDSEIAHLNYLLSNVEARGGSRLDGRVEVYACKRVGADRREGKQLEHMVAEEHINSSPEASASPFGPLCESSSRRVFVDLISLLNASFPDYDFSMAKAGDFQKERSLAMVQNAIDARLESTFDSYRTQIRTPLWAAVERQVGLSGDTNLYSYCPEPAEDPFGEDGSLWSLNYFFYNKKARKVVFVHFLCNPRGAVSTLSGALSQDRGGGRSAADWSSDDSGGPGIGRRRSGDGSDGGGEFTSARGAGGDGIDSSRGGDGAQGKDTDDMWQFE